MTRAQQYRNFWLELANLIDAGFPMPRALRIIYMSLSDKDKFNRRIKKMVRLVNDDNVVFTEAMAQTGLFSRAEINALRGGDVGGNMEVVLWRIVQGNIPSRADQYEEFFRTFGGLISSGVPLLRSLDISKERLDEPFKMAVQKVRDAASEGETIADAMHKCGEFSVFEVSLIDVGEETGQLDQMLMKLANLSRPYKFV